MKVVAVLWPDNSMTVAGSAAGALERVAADQWRPMSVNRLKEVLSDRAWVWSSAAVDPTLDNDDFLDELERAGMVLVERFDA